MKLNSTFLLYILAITLLMSITPVAAQKTSAFKITEVYEETTLLSALKSIEQKYPVKFFFNQEWIKEIKVSGRYIEEPIESFLASVLKDTEVSFVVFDSTTIVLVKDPREDKKSLEIEAQRESEKIETVVIGEEVLPYSQNEVTLRGYLKDASNGEPLIGATVNIPALQKGSITNEIGYYSISIPAGEYIVVFNSSGLQEEKRVVKMFDNGQFSLEMFEMPTHLQEITVMGESSDQNVVATIMGKTTMNIQAIEKMPAFMGEVDVMKSVLMLPGVNTVGEGASGINVRGGGVDQNLILLDDAPIFNSSHLFGFFSVFNPSTVKDLDFYRGGIPAKYGGRISSVMDIRQKDGNLRTFTGSGGIGLISSRLTLEGPIVKDKASFLVAGRSSYSDWILRQVKDVDIRRSSALFYDATLKGNYAFSSNSKLYATAYLSKDSFRFASDTTYNWETRNFSAKYNYLFNDNFLLNLTGAYSLYQYDVQFRGLEKAFELQYKIVYKNLKADFTYFLKDHQLNFGASTILYDFEQGRLKPLSDFSSINETNLQDERALESGVYLSDDITISKRLSISAGVRYSLFHRIGPSDVYVYPTGISRDIENISDTIRFNKKEIVEKYDGIEPRFSVRYSLSDESSVKFGYNSMNQYIHLISNTTAITPLDIWKPSGKYIQPQSGHQYALGYFRNFQDNTFETSLEVFYKDIKNILDYKDGADLLLNKALEADLLQGDGLAYGVELMVRKSKGRLTGWFNYTYSRSKRKIKGKFPEESINEGNFYPANYDQPNNLFISTKYQISRRITLNTNFTYSTGRPFTAPVSRYIFNGITIANYSDRNQYRIPDYHRLDLSITVETNHKKEKSWEGSWTFSIYNVYGRKNAYSVFFKDEADATPRAYKLSILGRPFPAVTYNFKF